MKFEPSQRTYNIIAAAIVLISALIVFSSLTRGHVWGDDFAGYLNQANAILNGQTDVLVAQNGRMNLWSSTRPGPDAYPWGYPLFLAPILALFGISPLVFKSLNIVFWVIGLWAVYQFFRKRLSNVSSLLALGLLAFSPLFIQMNDLIQSDIPFFTLVYLVFYTKEYLGGDSILKKLFLGILIFFAIFTRTTGILLFLLFVPDIYSARTDPNKLVRSIIPIFTALVLFILQVLVLPSGESSYFSHFDLFTLKALFNNIATYIQAGGQLVGTSTVSIVFYGLCWVLFLFTQRNAFRTDISTQLFFYGTLFILLIWPEEQGARFLLPLLPIFLGRVFEGVEKIGLRITWVKPIFVFISVAFAVVLLYNGLVFGVNNIRSNRDVNGPFDPVSAEAFNAVRKKTNPEDVLVFFKPRAALFFTQRLSYTADTCEGLVNGDFVLIHLKQADNLQIEPDAITACPMVDADPIFKNQRFVLYAIDNSITR